MENSQFMTPFSEDDTKHFASCIVTHGVYKTKQHISVKGFSSVTPIFTYTAKQKNRETQIDVIHMFP